MNAGKSYERTACLFAYLGNEDLDLVTDLKVLAGDLLGLDESSEAVVCLKKDISVVGEYLADRCCDDLFSLVFVSLLYGLALTLADALNDLWFLVLLVHLLSL